MPSVSTPPDELSQVGAWVERMRVLLNSIQVGHLDAVEEQRQKLADVVVNLQTREAAVAARELAVATAEADLIARRASVKAQLAALAELSMGE